MLCGCIDIGTNTTRVLVAEARDGQLTEVLQRRAFTCLGRGLGRDGAIPAHKIDETVRAVIAHFAAAEAVGAKPIRIVATQAIRSAANQAEFCAALRVRGMEVTILDGAEEARLAFLGATSTLGRPIEGLAAVVDVGGGSTEIAVGTTARGVEWSTSLPVGSGLLADRYLHHDPPTAAEMLAAQAHALRVLDQAAPPRVALAVAVGGSAASLRKFVGPVLSPDALKLALRTIVEGSAKEIAQQWGLDIERVRLLPAGLLTLSAAADRLELPLEIGNGGLREGILLDLAGQQE